MALIPKEAFTALADTQKSMAEMLELLTEIRDLLKEQSSPVIETLHVAKRQAK